MARNWIRCEFARRVPLRVLLAEPVRERADFLQICVLGSFLAQGLVLH